MDDIRSGIVSTKDRLHAARSLFDRLDAIRQSRIKESGNKNMELKKVQDYLSIADSVDDALDKLSEQLFGKIAKAIEDNLTLALQEVLEQNITLKVSRDYKRGRATIGFHIEREGQKEDIMKGQGGSVANILSVGLRFFALQTLDPAEHRRFLVLDEQDCWLRPDLVPHLVKIVYQAGKALGFQVIYISHHNITAFQQYADKIYEFIPGLEGVQVKEVKFSPAMVDGT